MKKYITDNYHSNYRLNKGAPDCVDRLLLFSR